ncbi:MAG TPA: tetratricopeptide repeat protein [Gemmataceae bacterium]
MRWGFIILAIALLAGAAWATHVVSVHRRAGGQRQLADDACRRFDFAAAQAHMRAYLALRPTDGEAHLFAARCARRTDLQEEFTGPDPTLRELAFQHLTAAERLGTAPASLRRERLLGRIQHGYGSSEERMMLRQRVQEGGPDASPILEALIHGYLRHLQLDKALACSETLLQREPENVLALVWRGRIWEQFGQWRAARADYALAVRLVPDFPVARYYLAESLLRANLVGEAAIHFETLKEQAGDNLLVRLAWAKCCIARGDDLVGQELLDAWLTEAPKNHPRRLEALSARARLALALGRPEEAEGFARRALQESPLDRYALYDLARSLNAQGRRSEAGTVEQQLADINQALRKVAQCKSRLVRDPDNLSLRQEIGATYLRLGRPGEALVWLNSILVRDPQYRPALQSLADYHTQAGNHALAQVVGRRLAAVSRGN